MVFKHLLHSIEDSLRTHQLAQKLFFRLKLRYDFPLNLNLEVTNHCNLRCIICPRRLTNRGFGFMNWEIYHKIIDEVVQEGGVWTLTLIKDGEPLLHPHLDRFVAYAKQRQAAHKIEIFTNGFFLNRYHWGERLIDSGLDLLNVSIDAATRETYRQIRGVDVFPQVVANLKDFVKLRSQRRLDHPRIVVRAVGIQANQHELADIKTMWQGVADWVSITPFSNYAGGVPNSLGPKKHPASARYPCPVLWFNPVVNWDGEVTTCCVNYLRNELIVGDAKTQTLKQIWSSSEFNQVRQAHLSGNLKNYPACARCTYWQKFAKLGNLARLPSPSETNKRQNSW